MTPARSTLAAVMIALAVASPAPAGGEWTQEAASGLPAAGLASARIGAADDRHDSLGQERRTSNVILITADGVRHQELFGGLDHDIVVHEEESGIEDRLALEATFDGESAVERRERLMPFFWTVLAPRGVVLGSRADGSTVSVTNPHRLSYPSYAEILTGQVQPEITGNFPIQIPRETVLELVRRQLRLQPTGVAAFTSWILFPYIVEHEPGSIVVNARGPLPEHLENADLRRLANLEQQTLSPWTMVRQNVFTEALAFAYVKEFRPRLLYLALDETDEWAHKRRYDRTLQAINHFDATLRRLWELIQSNDAYRDSTTLVITTDHGRGRTAADWTSHGPDVPGADEVWIAIIGPDTPARGVVVDHPPVQQTQIATTVAALLGLDLATFNPEAGPPIAIARR